MAGKNKPPVSLKKVFEKNHYLDESANLINEIKIGDRIALKTTPNKNKIPFNTNGKIVSVMEIKAIGTVIRNYYDGKRIWKIKQTPRIGCQPELIDEKQQHFALLEA